MTTELRTHDQIRRRMEQIADILTGAFADRLEDQYRADLQAEYRRLEARLDKITGIKIIWVEESEMLLWLENGRPVKGLSGPIAREKFNKIKTIIKPYNHDNRKNTAKKTTAKAQ